MKKINVQALVYASVLLAICIASQVFKNLSVYITGPIINTCLVICVLASGFGYALALSIITPITSFFITGSPIMSAIPLIIPCVMAGNALLVLFVALFKNKFGKKAGLPISMALGCIAKAAFMGVVISLIIIPSLIPEVMAPKMAVFQTTFSVTQLITAVIGCVLAYIIWLPLKRFSNR